MRTHILTRTYHHFYYPRPLSCMDMTLRHGALFTILILVCIAFSTACMSIDSYPPPNGSGTSYVDYHRTGGIAAFEDHLVIYENRTATVSRRAIPAENITTKFSINETEATNLNNLFRQAKFLELKHFYPAPYEGADYFTYVIDYRGYQIQTEDTGVPSELIPIIDELNHLVVSGCGGDVCPIP
ncbi:MAG: hypothetical protein LUP99_00965 [Methanomicrobiales archaeon]|nr:hypothetical protein [Methanomicrobiales archaeon]